MDDQSGRMIIFLGDLQNSSFRYVRNSIPIGVGYIAAWLHSRFGNQIEISIFRRFEEVYDAFAEKKPHILALGSYCWNTNLTLNTARCIKENSPDTITAVGGADISPSLCMAEKYLRANPQIDFYLPNEGEQPMENLVAAMLGQPGDVRRRNIRGCLSLDPGTCQVTGEVIDRFEGDINDIPSPYFGGWMDRFLSDVDYMPSIQTSRGCPYHCTYCVSGRDSWCRVVPFNTERVKAEIDYVAARSPNLFLRFADENFGLLPRDVEIAEYIVKKREQCAFPQSGSIYTDKHPTERIRHIACLLREIIPFCISFQSATPHVLENIKRVNLKDEDVAGAIAFARRNRMIVVSELIFGLPGETVESFLASIDKLMEFRFESMEINPLQILKGAEMDDPEYRSKFGIQTMFAVAEKGLTKHPALENIEIDEFAVGTSTMSPEEYFKMLRFIFLLDFAHYRSYLREFLFFFENHGIKASTVLMEIIEVPGLSPILARAAQAYEEGIRSFLKRSPEEVIEYVKADVSSGDMAGFYDLRRKLMADLLSDDMFPAIAEEIKNSGLRLHEKLKGTVTGEFKDEIKTIEQFTVSSFIPMHREVPERIGFETEYDIPAWVENNYSPCLSWFRRPVPVKLTLRVPGFKLYQDIWGMDESVMTKYLKAFRIFTSANRRRIIEKDKGRETAG